MTRDSLYTVLVIFFLIASVVLFVAPFLNPLNWDLATAQAREAGMLSDLMQSAKALYLALCFILCSDGRRKNDLPKEIEGGLLIIFLAVILVIV